MYLVFVRLQTCAVGKYRGTMSDILGPTPKPKQRKKSCGSQKMEQRQKDKMERDQVMRHVKLVSLQLPLTSIPAWRLPSTRCTKHNHAEVTYKHLHSRYALKFNFTIRYCSRVIHVHQRGDKRQWGAWTRNWEWLGEVRSKDNHTMPPWAVTITYKHYQFG